MAVFQWRWPCIRLLFFCSLNCKGSPNDGEYVFDMKKMVICFISLKTWSLLYPASIDQVMYSFHSLHSKTWSLLFHIHPHPPYLSSFFWHKAVDQESYSPHKYEGERVSILILSSLSTNVVQMSSTPHHSISSVHTMGWQNKPVVGPQSRTFKPHAWQSWYVYNQVLICNTKSAFSAKISWDIAAKKKDHDLVKSCVKIWVFGGIFHNPKRSWPCEIMLSKRDIGLTQYLARKHANILFHPHSFNFVCQLLVLLLSGQLN